MLIDAISRRRSIRDFSDVSVSDEEIGELLRAAMYAPTSRNNRAVEFIVVRDAATKEDLFQVVGQDFIRQAPILVIPVTDPSKTHQPIQDISIASAFIMLQATAMGLGTVWKHLQPEWVEAVKRRLGIPESMTVINLLPVGRPAEVPEPHRPEEHDPQRIHPEKW
ncbi:MAG: nitroreductase family protein [Patescibacteria group bacterium]|nr:nitroreductase family protein [Patescibacteria group bacterium]